MKTGSIAALATALTILTATAAAALVFAPVSTEYDDPGLATVNLRGGGGQIQVRTTDLQGRLAVKASDLPPASGAPAQGCAVMPFTQDLTLSLDLAKGVAEGSSSGQIHLDGKVVRLQAAVQGSASCMPFDGAACGQVIVDLDLRGALANPGDPAAVGLLRMQMLGSLVRGNPTAPWAAMSADTSLGLSRPLVTSILDTMEEGECGV
jgi:hypothetical protein